MTYSVVFAYMDSPYKTNEYRLPSIEFVIFNSLEMAYSVVFAYMDCENEDNVT
jgi:hypothetical protein